MLQVTLLAAVLTTCQVYDVKPAPRQYTVRRGYITKAIDTERMQELVDGLKAKPKAAPAPKYNPATQPLYQPKMRPRAYYTLPLIAPRYVRAQNC